MKFMIGSMCILYVLADPSVIDLTRAPQYFLFFIELHHKYDPQSEFSKLGFPFQ